MQSTSYVVSVFRFDECGISPLTVQALTDAGYVQTTVVQEAALPICLEGVIFFVFTRVF
jgi:superfamily II DNA/RNA helicase